MKRFALLVVSIASLTACSAAVEPQEPAPLEGDRPEIPMTPPAEQPPACADEIAETFVLVDGVSIASGDTIDSGNVVQLVSRPSGTAHRWQIHDVEGDRLLGVLEEAAPHFEPPRPGTYEITLELVDGSCTLASEPFMFSVVTAAPPSPGLTIELSWYTPGDVDEHDLDSADLDLHYRHPSGFWNSDPWDCWAANKAPDWGPAGLPGNPHLLASAFGFRPEILEHKAPEAAFYEFGVHYAEDAEFGRSVAIVSVYYNGELRYEDAATLSPGAFWPVGLVEGSTGTVFPHEPSSNAAIRQ